ncbi:hypothetical protein ACFL51_01900, partial [Myxococcota bacterium]
MPDEPARSRPVQAQSGRPALLRFTPWAMDWGGETFNPFDDQWWYEIPTDKVLRVSRDSGPDRLVFDRDRLVSKVHADLWMEGDALHLKNLSTGQDKTSVCGTTIGTRDERDLTDGEWLRFGSTCLRFYCRRPENPFFGPQGDELVRKLMAAGGYWSPACWGTFDWIMTAVFTAASNGSREPLPKPEPILFIGPSGSGKDYLMQA